MIKLIIFDLDGVLTKTKDLHFRALNKALENQGEKPILMEDHISKFDGLSTMQKLGMLEVKDPDWIYQLKQMYTSNELQTKIVPDKKFIELFGLLIKEGYYICIASNSIRETSTVIPYKMGLRPYITHIVSNQDVTNKKPHPEMYLQCMQKVGVGPRETLIIEDSYIGRQGAYNSGAYLCPVNNPDEVTYPLLKLYIEKYNENKPKWKDDKMNVLIPMAGAGSRFQKAGYTFPKPLIEVNGKPMIQVVVDNLNIDANYIFLVLKEHYEKYNLKYMLEAIVPGCTIVQVDHITEGGACTTLLATHLIDNDKPLLIANSDQYLYWDSSDFMYSMQQEDIGGGIVTFHNSHPKWSYVRIGTNGFVAEIAEKKPISNNATAGVYYWKRGDDYVQCAEQMIEKNIRTNGEFYVAPVYNEAIDCDVLIKTYHIDKMQGLGTPEDLNTFLSENKNDLHIS